MDSEKELVGVKLDSEIELVRKAKQGDEDAFNKLAQIYKPYINLISRRYFLIGGDTEDIVQEGLIGMYKAVLSFKEEENVTFKTFALLCINRAIKTIITKQNRQRNKALNESISVDMEMEDEDAWAVLLISDELSAEEELIKKQKIKFVLSEMNKTLNDTQKQVLKMYLINKTYAEIAQIMGKDVKFVDNTLMQIKRKLAYIKEKEDL